MNDLRKLLQEKYDWVSTTRGAKHATVSLTTAQLAELLYLLRPTEMVGLNLNADCCRSHPHENMSRECEQKTLEARAAVESRRLSPMEPAGTKRSPAEIARLLAERYGQMEEMRKKALHICA